MTKYKLSDKLASEIFGAITAAIMIAVFLGRLAGVLGKAAAILVK